MRPSHSTPSSSQSPPNSPTWTQCTFVDPLEAEIQLCADRDLFIQSDAWGEIQDCLSEDTKRRIKSESFEGHLVGFKSLFIHLNQKRARGDLRTCVEEYFRTTKHLEHLLSESSARLLAMWGTLKTHFYVFNCTEPPGNKGECVDLGRYPTVSRTA